MNIPTFALPVRTMLRPTCSTPPDNRVLVLLLGTRLTTGRRTITNILRTVRHQAPGQAASSQRVWSRRRWSMWVMARAVIRFLLDHVVPPGPVLLAGDDTVTEPPGPHVLGQGRHRDGVRSSHRDMASRWGHQWGVLSLLVKLPFATRPWALPVLVALSRSPEWDRVHGKRHKTPAPIARLLRARLVRWFPERHCLFVGDSGDGTSETARVCSQHRQHLTLVRQFSGDAALSAPPPPRTCRTLGRPRVQGPNRASPQAVVAHTATRTSLTVAWSGGPTRALEIVGGTGHWYRIGEDLVEVRWVYVQEGTGSQRDEDFLTTALTMKPPQRVECYTPRWSSETTFQECREYLQLESTTGDGQQTVLRVTPCLFGLYTMVVLLDLQLPKSSSRLRAIFWRGQSTVTCSDMLPWVRRSLGEQGCFHTRAHAQEFSKLSPSFPETILYALAPAAERTGKDMSQASTFLEGMA